MADVSKHLQKAEKYLQKGKLLDALEEYLLAYREDPTNDSLVEIIAELYLKQNKTDKALECYGYLFDKYKEESHGPAAALIYRKMARLGVKDPERLLACGVLLEKERPPEARDCLRAAADLFEQRSEREKALEALTRLAALERENAETQVRLGRVAESLSKNETASKAYERAAVLLHPSNAEKALGYLTQARELWPSEHTTSRQLAIWLLEAGQAEQAARVLEAIPLNALPDRSRLLADCYLALGILSRAEELLWPLTSKNPDVFNDLQQIFERYVDEGRLDRALPGIPQLKQEMFAANKDKQFRAWVDKLRQKEPTIHLLKFLAVAYREMNLTSVETEIQAQLFGVAVEGSDFAQAATTLEILSDLDRENSANEERLKQLEGKLDEARFNALASRVRHLPPPGASAKAAAGVGLGMAMDWRGEEAAPAAGSLDDALLEAEMLLQFTGKEAALPHLRHLMERFPGEERNNKRYHDILLETGLLSAPVFAPPAPTPSSTQSSGALPLEDIRRVSNITRAMFRQTSAKGILSVAVNEIGKAWGVSRCVAALCSPGKPPSAVFEYCATGIRRSDAASLARVFTALMQITSGGKAVAAEQAATAPGLVSISPVLKFLNIVSLLALPLIESDQMVGLIVLQTCETKRSWEASEIELLRAIADQAMLAAGQAKLRSLADVVGDSQSGLLARSTYIDCIVKQCHDARDKRAPVSVALIEFSGATKSAGELGEKGMEYIMREAAELLTSRLRDGDIGVRYDNSTLAVILPEMAGEDAVGLMEKLRRIASVTHAGTEQGMRVTCAVSQAFTDEGSDPVDSATELINRLEEAREIARTSSTGNCLLPVPQPAV